MSYQDWLKEKNEKTGFQKWYEEEKKKRASGNTGTKVDTQSSFSAPVIAGTGKDTSASTAEKILTGSVSPGSFAPTKTETPKGSFFEDYKKNSPDVERVENPKSVANVILGDDYGNKPKEKYGVFSVEGQGHIIAGTAKEYIGSMMLEPIVKYKGSWGKEIDNINNQAYDVDTYDSFVKMLSNYPTNNAYGIKLDDNQIMTAALVAAKAYKPAPAIDNYVTYRFPESISMANNLYSIIRMTEMLNAGELNEKQAKDAEDGIRVNWERVLAAALSISEQIRVNNSATSEGGMLDEAGKEFGKLIEEGQKERTEVLENSGTVGKFVGNLETAGLQMLGDRLLSGGTKMSPVFLFKRVYGTSYAEKINEGWSEQDAEEFANLQGGKEVLTELLFNASVFGSTYGSETSLDDMLTGTISKVVSKFIKNPEAVKFTTKLVSGGTGEMLEEVLSVAGDPATEAIALGDTAPLSRYKEVEFYGEMAYSGLLGFAMGSVGAPFESVASKISGDNYRNTMKQAGYEGKDFAETYKELKKEYGNSVSEKDAFELWSYGKGQAADEKENATKTFVPDYSKYKGSKHEDAAKETLDNAVKAGANNTKAVRDFAELLANISSNSGLVFDYADNKTIKEYFIKEELSNKMDDIIKNNEEEVALKELRKIIDFGNKVAEDDIILNGIFKDGKIIVNLDSANALNRIAGHEITHSLENAKSYDKFAEALLKYAETKGENINEKLAQITELYKGVPDADARRELVANLTGKYLFTDYEFIKSLSADRNIFRKVWDEIKYLCKIAVSGSKEARELARVEKMFAKVYEESVRKIKNTDTEGGGNYSIAKTSKMSYLEQLAKIEKGILNGSNSLYIGIPNERIKGVFSNSPFAMNQKDYRKSRRESAKNRNYSSHSVPLEFFKVFPQEINTAPMVFDNGDKATIITSYSMKDTNGKDSYVIAGVWKNQQMENDTVNLVKSVYPLDDFKERIIKYAESGNLLVTDKNKAEQMLTTIGIQPAEVSRLLNLTQDIVSQPNGKINDKIVNNNIAPIKQPIAPIKESVSPAGVQGDLAPTKSTDITGEQFKRSENIGPVREDVAHQSESVTETEESVINEGDSVINEGDSVINEGESVTETGKNEKITIDMSDDARAELLDKKRVNVVSFDAERTKTLNDVDFDVLQQVFKKDAKPIIEKVSKDFGILNKTYFNPDIELDFEYSKGSLKESINKQHAMYGDFVKMLSVFPDVVENAVGIETHNDKYKGTIREDTTLKQMYVLASAFSDGTSVIPVKLEVKEFSDKTNKLYLSVVLTKKESRYLNGNLGQNQLNTAPPTSVISIAELVRFVNPSEGDFLKYFPDSMLDNEQIEGKNKALTKDTEKIEKLKEPSNNGGENVNKKTKAENIAPIKAPIAPVKTENKTVSEDNLGNEASAETDTRGFFVKPTVKKTKKAGWFNTFRTHFLDDASVFEDVSKKTKNRELEAKFNFTKFSRARAQSLIGKGKKSEGVRALSSIMQDVKKTGKEADFFDYMYHLLNIDRMTLDERYGSENKPVFGHEIGADVSKAKVKRYVSENPEFERLANDIYDFVRYERTLLVESGFISQETADLWQEQTPHYIPIKRVTSNNYGNMAIRGKNVNINSPVMKAKGGNQKIEDLFITLADRTERIYSAIAMNNFGVELKNTLDSVVDTQKSSIDDAEVSIDKSDELLQKGTDGKSPTFSVFEGGKKITFEITEDMYEALKPVARLWQGTSVVLNKINKFRRGVITEYSPLFLVRNPIRDVQDLLINSQHPIKTYENFPIAIKELMSKGKGKWISEYIENGGEEITYFDKSNKEFAKEKTGFFPLEKISAANNFIERIPRLAEYIASRQAGASIEVAMLDASRVTTNFQAGGDVTKFLNRNGFTFLNASVQGALQAVRNVREAKMNGLRGWAKLAAKTILCGLPAAAVLLNNLLFGDDEEYEELSDYVKNNNYIVGKYDNGKFVIIPKGRTAAVIQNAFSQIGNFLTGNDDIDFEMFADLVLNNLAPNNPLDNNIIAPIVQTISNRTWYGEKLVPTRLEDLPSDEQYDETTDALSRWLGEKTKISPYKINYLLDQYSGAIGDILLPMSTPEAERGEHFLLAPIADKFTADSVIKNQNVSDFYTTVENLKKNANSAYATDEDVVMSKYMNSVNSDISKLYKKKRDIQNSNFTNTVKYNTVREVQKQINEIVTDALYNYENVMIDGRYAFVGGKHFYKNIDNEWTKLSDKQITKMYEDIRERNISEAEYWYSESKYPIAVFVGYDKYSDYSDALNDIEADKDKNGKSISGSRKKKVFNYINSLNLSKEKKMILFRSEYPSDDAYNATIVEYLKGNKDMSYDDKVALLSSLGIQIKNGRAYW